MDIYEDQYAGDERARKLLPAALAIIITILVCIALVIGIGCKVAFGSEYTDDQIADAIYLAEGGAKTRHPYGILVKYKHTTPRQACINTIRHARRDWDGNGDFIMFLQRMYAPIGVKNDPTGLNRNWLKNVNYFLARSK